MSVRLQITMSEELMQELDQVSKESGQTLSETFRKALVLYLEARRRTQSGKSGLCFYDAESHRSKARSSDCAEQLDGGREV